MNAPFKIDGRTFSGIDAVHLTRLFEIRDGPNAALMLAGNYERDVLGTYFDYQVELGIVDMSQNDYDALFDILSAPVNSHSVEMPYGQGVMTFDAMIQAGQDELEMLEDSETWWGNLTLTFKASEPQRIPD